LGDWEIRDCQLATHHSPLSTLHSPLSTKIDSVLEGGKAAEDGVEARLGGRVGEEDARFGILEEVM
jgi:hypothetical protein